MSEGGTTLPTVFLESVSDMAGLSIMLQMLAKQARNFVLQTLGDAAEYDETVGRVRMLVANKAAMARGPGPVPMHVGHVQAEHMGEWQEEWFEGG